MHLAGDYTQLLRTLHCAYFLSNSCDAVLQWHALDRSEQAKYYEMARKEKDLHMQLYPGWSARDNYAAHNKKKKRKKEQVTPQENKGASSGIAFGHCHWIAKFCVCGFFLFCSRIVILVSESVLQAILKAKSKFYCKLFISSNVHAVESS